MKSEAMFHVSFIDENRFEFSFLAGDIYEYDYDTFKENFDYGGYADVQPVPVDEKVQIEFEKKPNMTQGQIKHYVRHTFQKYLDQSNNGAKLKAKFDDPNRNLTDTSQRGQLKLSSALSDEEDRISKFVIIGAMKCGTTAINNFLRFHPGAVPTGELYFFLKAYQRNLTSEELYEEYLNLMPGKLQISADRIKPDVNQSWLYRLINNELHICNT